MHAMGWKSVIVIAALDFAAAPTRAQDYDWGPLGSGMNNTVYALTEFSGELVAGALSRPLAA